METPRLTVWQPNSIQLTGRIYNHSVTLDEKGLRIKLVDEVGVRVDIVYDRSSQIIGDYVWSYCFTSEILKSDLVNLIQEAQKLTNTTSTNRLDFYKMINSKYVDSIKKTGWTAEVELEHHLFPVSDGVLEVISDYEPKIIYNQIQS